MKKSEASSSPPGDYVEDRRGPIITTYPSGTKLHPFDASADEIHLEDIAHHLSLVCRFGGGCREFYSVAQHSVLVSRVATRLAADATPSSRAFDRKHLIEVQRLALMHDADEYVFGDMIAPVKSRCLDYQTYAARFQSRIFEKYGILKDPHLWKTFVKPADRLMRRVEAFFLGKDPMEDGDAPPIPSYATRGLVEAWFPHRAENEFIDAAEALGLR